MKLQRRDGIAGKAVAGWEYVRCGTSEKLSTTEARVVWLSYVMLEEADTYLDASEIISELVQIVKVE